MGQAVTVQIEMPDELEGLRLPSAVDRRLQDLLDRQDRGETLTDGEREEAEALVDLAERLSLLRLRSERAARG